MPVAGSVLPGVRRDQLVVLAPPRYFSCHRYPYAYSSECSEFVPVLAPVFSPAIRAAFLEGATITIRRPCSCKAWLATFIIVVFPDPAGPMMVTSGALLAIATAAAACWALSRWLFTA